MTFNLYEKNLSCWKFVSYSNHFTLKYNVLCKKKEQKRDWLIPTEKKQQNTHNVHEYMNIQSKTIYIYSLNYILLIEKYNWKCNYSIRKKSCSQRSNQAREKRNTRMKLIMNIQSDFKSIAFLLIKMLNKRYLYSVTWKMGCIEEAIHFLKKGIQFFLIEHKSNELEIWVYFFK